VGAALSSSDAAEAGLLRSAVVWGVLDQRISRVTVNRPREPGGRLCHRPDLGLIAERSRVALLRLIRLVELNEVARGVLQQCLVPEAWPVIALVDGDPMLANYGNGSGEVVDSDGEVGWRDSHAVLWLEEMHLPALGVQPGSRGLCTVGSRDRG
jgi:hypothetical protein